MLGLVSPAITLLLCVDESLALPLAGNGTENGCGCGVKPDWVMVKEGGGLEPRDKQWKFAFRI